jgi:hypothetical protein
MYVNSCYLLYDFHDNCEPTNKLDQIHQHSSTLTFQSGGQQHGSSDTRMALQWTINAIQVLNQISGVISKTNKAWKVFVNELDGDVGYFSDIMTVRNSTKSHAFLSICNTKAAFEALAILEDNLGLLEKSCRTLADTVSWRALLYFVTPLRLGRRPVNKCVASASFRPRKQRSSTAK